MGEGVGANDVVFVLLIHPAGHSQVVGVELALHHVVLGCGRHLLLGGDGGVVLAQAVVELLFEGDGDGVGGERLEVEVVHRCAEERVVDEVDVDGAFFEHDVAHIAGHSFRGDETCYLAAFDIAGELELAVCNNGGIHRSAVIDVDEIDCFPIEFFDGNFAQNGVATVASTHRSKQCGND